MELEKNHVNVRVESGTLVKIITICFMFWLAFLLRDVVFVILMAVVIASSIQPSIRWFMERKIPRVISVLFIYFSLILIFVGMFYFLFIPLLSDLQTFLSALPSYFGSFSDAYLSGPFASVGNLINNIPISNIVEQANTSLASLSKNALSTASVVLGGLLSLVLTIVLSFYLSVQQDGITNFLKTVAPSRHRKYVIALWDRAEKKIGLWMQGQLLLGVIVAVLVYLGLTLLGVKHALLLGFLSGIFELIPLFGPILSSIPGIVIAFSDSGFTLALIVAGLYLIIQQFESQLIYPLVVKKVVGVPPIISIVALVVGAKLAGFMGLLLSVPVAAILMEFFNDLEKDRIMEEGRGK